jgi:hypothetical protein
MAIAYVKGGANLYIEGQDLAVTDLQLPTIEGSDHDVSVPMHLPPMRFEFKRQLRRGRPDRLKAWALREQMKGQNRAARRKAVSELRSQRRRLNTK